MKRLYCFLLIATALGAQDPLDHSKWRLTETTSPVGMPDRGAAMLMFDAGRFAMSACNMTSGRYRTDGSKIVAEGPPRTTRKACSTQMSKVDQALVQSVTANEGFTVAGDRLTLKGPAGASFVFSREPLPSKEAVTKFIYVAPFKKECTGVGKMECLQVKENPEDPWRLHYSGIVGFDPVPGIQYRLRIKEDKRTNVPADASSIVWYLDMVVEQKVIDRAAAEAAKK